MIIVEFIHQNMYSVQLWGKEAKNDICMGIKTCHNTFEDIWKYVSHSNTENTYSHVDHILTLSINFFQSDILYVESRGIKLFGDQNSRRLIAPLIKYQNFNFIRVHGSRN